MKMYRSVEILTSLIVLGILGWSYVHNPSAVPKRITVTIQQVQLTVPQTWTMIRSHAYNSSTVTVVQPRKGNHRLDLRIRVNVSPFDASLYAGSIVPVISEKELISRHHPYWIQESLSTHGQFQITRTLTAANLKQYTVTALGSTTERFRILDLWRTIRWPTALSLTGAVYDLLTANRHVQPYWLNLRDGWLIMDGEGEMGFVSIYLYGTTDGGWTWHYLAPTHEPPSSFPNANSTIGRPVIFFRTPDQGWMAQVNYSQTAVSLYVTHDAGRHWHFVRLITVPEVPTTVTLTNNRKITNVRFTGPDLTVSWGSGPTLHPPDEHRARVPLT